MKALNAQRLLIRLSAIFLLFFVENGAGQSIVHLEGWVPLDLNAAAMEREYGRLHVHLAPHRPMSDDTLIIRFYRQADIPSGQPLLPEWGGGGAIGANRIVIPVDRRIPLHTSTAATVRHEMVHILLNRLNRGVRIPRWFHEGMAMTLAGEVSWEKGVVLSWAILTGRLPALADIDSVNTFSRTRATLCYAQSHAAVEMLIRTYGMESMRHLLDAVRHEGDFDRGIERELGLTPPDLYREIRQYTVQRYRYAFLLLDNMILWGGIILLFLAGAAVAVIRKRYKMRLLAEQETEALPRDS